MITDTEKLKVGDHVVKNPLTWEPCDADAKGKGEGVGLVVKPPYELESLKAVDVLWPNGVKYFSFADELIKVKE
jgi:hypothetical protein